MPPRDPSRRQLLIGGSATAALAVSGGAVLLSVQAASGLEDEAAAAVGKAYLAAHPEYRDAARLRSELFGDGMPDDLLGWAASRQAQEFAAGHLVNVDGWLLSQTEAHLCALAWLQRASA